MAGSIKRTFGPLALTTVYTTNVYNNTSALIYDVVRHLHVVNKLLADTFRLFLGATGANAAGTELYYNEAVAAASTWDRYMATKLVSTDFLVGGAATTLTLVIEAEGEQYVV
jgi:hypothetical protein